MSRGRRPSIQNRRGQRGSPRDDALGVHGSEMKPTEALSDEERHRRLNTRLFVRATPRQKLDLIELHQRGTRVAREAADMLLQDDAFSIIVAAVRQGRVIFRNIR